TPPANTAPPLPGTLGNGPTAALQALPLTITPTFTEVSGPRGRYWTADGQDPQVLQDHPIQPQTLESVVTPHWTAHGVLITSLASHDVPGVNPVVDSPANDQSNAAPETKADDVAWPASLAAVTTSHAPYGRAQDLVVVPGQFRGSTTDGTGVQ